MFKLEFQGLQDFKRKKEELEKRFEDNIDYEEMLDEIVKLARKRCPVKTGDMEKAIHWENRGAGEYVLICDVPYAKYIEYGTRYFPIGTIESPRGYKSTSGKTASVPFLRSAIWDVRRQFPNRIKKVTDTIFK